MTYRCPVHTRDDELVVQIIRDATDAGVRLADFADLTSLGEVVVRRSLRRLRAAGRIEVDHARHRYPRWVCTQRKETTP